MADKEKKPAHEVLVEKLNSLFKERGQLLSQGMDTVDISSEERYAKAMESKGEQIAMEAKIAVLMEVLNSMIIPEEGKHQVQEVVKKLLDLNAAL